MWDSKRDTYVLNSLLDSVQESKGGMIWENGTETCKISYVKRIASPGLMHDTGCSGLVHWDDPEGWYGEGGGEEGGGFRMGNTCTPVADPCQCMAKPIQYCKVISLQLNKFIFKKRNQWAETKKKKKDTMKLLIQLYFWSFIFQRVFRSIMI